VVGLRASVSGHPSSAATTAARATSTTARATTAPATCPHRPPPRIPTPERRQHSPGAEGPLWNAIATVDPKTELMAVETLPAACLVYAG
jgi:hypothetical protein